MELEFAAGEIIEKIPTILHSVTTSPLVDSGHPPLSAVSSNNRFELSQAFNLRIHPTTGIPTRFRAFFYCYLVS